MFGAWFCSPILVKKHATVRAFCPCNMCQRWCQIGLCIACWQHGSRQDFGEWRNYSTREGVVQSRRMSHPLSGVSEVFMRCPVSRTRPTPFTSKEIKEAVWGSCGHLEVILRSRPGKPNQRKGQNEEFMNFAHVCEFWCFFP